MQFNHPVTEQSSLVELLHQRTQQHPAQIAFSFWAEDEATEKRWTYQGLDERAHVSGARLRALNATGERVLLFSSCLDYMAAFFGCLRASASAVTSYPPRLNRSMPRLPDVAKFLWSFVAWLVAMIGLTILLQILLVRLAQPAGPGMLILGALTYLFLTPNALRSLNGPRKT